MALCTQVDVERRLQITFSDPAAPVIADLIAAAQGHIEREAGRPLEEAAHTEVFDGGRRLILLSNWPVSGITEVVEDGTILTGDDFAWYPDGRLLRVAAGNPIRWRPTRRQIIAVTYTAGYAPVPADLVDLCATAAARAFIAGRDAVTPDSAAGGVKRIRLEDREIEWAGIDTRAALTAAQLTADERAWVGAAYGREVLV
jgi:hypothetical protein